MLSEDLKLAVANFGAHRRGRIECKRFQDLRLDAESDCNIARPFGECEVSGYEIES
jgi:hypothetical protein